MTTGGVQVSVALHPDDVGLVVPGVVTDHGDGSYSFPVRAGTRSGSARLVIVADDGVDRATLAPYARLRLDPVAPLHCGLDRVDPIDGGRVPFTLNAPAHAGGFFLLVASASGTEPGLPLFGGVLPLNEDDVLVATWKGATSGRMPESVGPLDREGHGTGAFVAPPGLLGRVSARRLDWSAVLLGGGLIVATPPVGFEITSEDTP